jgi:hypothetical protein
MIYKKFKKEVNIENKAIIDITDITKEQIETLK